MEWIDVSHHNGTVDFHKVKEAGIGGVIVKLSEHLWQDPMSDHNIVTASSLGFAVSGYHYYKTTFDASAQGKYFAGLYKRYEDLLKVIPWADLEECKGQSRTQYQQGVDAFLQTVEDTLGYDAGIYTYPDFQQNYLRSERYYRHPLWFARYAPSGRFPVGWNAVLWQYTGAGSVPGVGTVDRSKLVGNISDILIPQMRKSI